MHQAYLKQQSHLARLKQQREEEIKSTMQSKPTICKKSARIHKQSTQRELAGGANPRLTRFLTGPKPIASNVGQQSARPSSRHAECLRSPVAGSTAQEIRRPSRPASREQRVSQLPA